MPLPTNRALNDVVSHTDINAIATQVNTNESGRVIATSADSEATLRTKLADARAAGKILELAAGTYTFTAALTGAETTPLHIRGAGRGLTTLVHNAGAVALVSAIGSFGSTVALTAATAKGVNVITVASTAGIAKDDVVLVRDTTQTFLGNSSATPAACFSDWAQVRSVDSATQLTLYERLHYPYTTSADYRKATFVDGLTVADLTIRGDAASGTIGARGITPVLCRNVTIERVGFKDLWDDPIRFENSIDFTVRDCIGVNMRDLEAAGDPYFVNLARSCSNGLVSGCLNRYGRHMVTAGGSVTDGAPNHVHVSDCIAVGMSASAFDTHPGTRNFTFADCIAHNLLPDLARTVHGFQIRGPDSAVINPIVTQADAGVSFWDGADRGLVQGGRLTDCAVGVYNRASVDLKVKGVEMERLTDAGVETVSRAGFPTLTGLVVEDCFIDAPTKFRYGTWDSSFITRNNRTPSGRRATFTQIPPAICRSESLDRRHLSSSALAPFTSGRLYMQAVALEAGDRMTQMAVMFAVDATTPTNLWYALYDENRALLGVTADNGAGALTPGAMKELALTTPLVVNYTGLHYFGIVSVAATPPQVRGQSATSNALALPPILTGNSTTGLTDPASAPTTAAALTASGVQTYCYVR